LREVNGEEMAKSNSLTGPGLRNLFLRRAFFVIGTFPLSLAVPSFAQGTALGLTTLGSSIALRIAVSIDYSIGHTLIYALCLIESLLIFLILARKREKTSSSDATAIPSVKRVNVSQELLVSLIDSVIDPIIVLDRNRRITLFNAAAVHAFGCNASAAIGSPIERFIPQRLRVAHRAHIADVARKEGLTSGPVAALWGLRANGAEFPIEASITEVESEGEKLTTLTIRDVSDHLRAEQAILESEERFQVVTNTAPMLVWMSGTDKLCTYFNKAWLSFSGRSMDAELGNGWMQGIHPDDLQKCMDVYTRAFDRREGFRMEYRLRRHDGEYRWIVDVGVPRFSPDGLFSGYIGSCIDVTDRKRAESDRLKMLEEIAHLNRVASMGQMAASLAHELAQPLAAILSNAQAAARFADRPEPDLVEIRGALADITEDDERARSFVQNMRSMFQRQTIRRTQLDLNRITFDVSRLVRNDAVRRGIQIRLNYFPDPILVYGDPTVLQQVILNLLNNGMDALENVPPGHKLLTLTTLIHRESELGTILVEDNGCGVSAEDKPKLFTPFFTTKKDGLGMGLSICHSLIESLNGQIALRDRDAPGTAFEVNLPLVPANQDDAEDQSDPELVQPSLGFY
jgi:PAS domain S-box-containing protein